MRNVLRRAAPASMLRAAVRQAAVRSVAVLCATAAAAAASLATGEPARAREPRPGTYLYVERGDPSRIEVLDRTTGEAGAYTAIGGGYPPPAGLRLAADGRHGYLASDKYRRVVEYDTAASRLGRTFDSGGRLGIDAVSSDGSRVYLHGYSPGAIEVLDTVGGAKLPPIDIGRPVVTAALSPDDALLYAIGREDGGAVHLVDAASGTLRATAPVEAPYQVVPGPGGRLAYVTTYRQDGGGKQLPSPVEVIDAASGAPVRTIELPGVARKFAISPDGDTGYAQLWDATGTQVIDLATGAVRRTLTGAVQWQSLDPDGSALYGYRGTDLVALDTATGAVRVLVADAPRGAVQAARTAPTPGPVRLAAESAVLVRKPLGVSGLAAALGDGAARSRTIIFRTVSGTELCRAVTDFTGRAACDALAPPGTTRKELLRGYEAVFKGDLQYDPARAHGAIAE
ncbi:YncE family protein [Streptomyces sp. NPDC057654]|uniref:YncE family protein n=1 Tax=Streptomyces sp. NPDC057654 TaxID=3346196 RepID=UPI003682E6F4